MSTEILKTQKRVNPELMDVLAGAKPTDLDILVDYITDSGKGRLALSEESRKKLVSGGRYTAATHALLAKELCGFGSNAILNLFRGPDGTPYRSVAQNVLEHLGGKAEKDDSVEDIERRVLERMTERVWARMDESQRKEFAASLKVATVSGPAMLAAVQAAIRAGGWATYSTAVQLANATAKLVLGRGLTFGANAALTRTIGVLAGPIGWVVTVLWTAVDLAGPAYRVAVPCVVHLAYLRQQQSLSTCEKCGTSNPKSSKFCGNCGAPLQEPQKQEK